MPTITFSLEDLQSLVGRKLKIKEVTELAEYAKGELESFDEKTGEVSVSLDDTNLPYLWSVEGLARLFRGVLGIEKGIPKFHSKKAAYEVIVHKGIEQVRPFIAAFVAKGKKLDDYSIKQLVQLQEKFCEGYGRRRQKVSIGLYSYKRIAFPVLYKAVEPKSVEFIPLEFSEKMNLATILTEHPKGRDYAWILADFKKYPILMDDKGDVLSFPPIINSNTTGRIEAGDTELFFEVTGTDEESILLSTNIFAQALFERGYDIYEAKISYPGRIITTPKQFNETIRIKPEDVEARLGLGLSKARVKELLEKARYSFDDFAVKVPDYRRDILHPFDIIEDIAIMYGYHNITGLPMKSYTVGGTRPSVTFVNRAREILVGLGYQELMSPMLSNKAVLYDRMNIKDTGTVEIEKFMSETYSVVRSSLLPLIMDVLSKNKHVEYPHRIFEQGLVTVRKAADISDNETIAFASAHPSADFTEAKQAVDILMKLLGCKWKLEAFEHGSFIPGRVGQIIVNGRKAGFIGEMSSIVLSNLQLEMPVAAGEINLSLLMASPK